MAKSLDFPWPVEVIYNPINLKSVEIKKLNSLELPPTFTFVGRLSSDKGIDILLGAAAKLKKREADFKICIIGSGSSENGLKDLAKKLDLESQIEFKGRLTPEELFPIVKNSIALIVPSRIQDPAPYVVMEASSLSTCSIVAKVGGLPEIATPSGFTFKKQDTDALAKILEYALLNPMEMLERGRRAYEYTEKQFSPSITAQQLADICHKLSPN
jgi:glycogen(starch) synthase